MHVLRRHPEMAQHLHEVLVTVRRPNAITPDPRQHRWRYWHGDVGPSRWLFVVVDWSVEPPAIVTAYGQRRIGL
jgi:hypothetical protein